MYVKDTGLVLEGGGMRGVFTTGVLDAFMEADVRFPYAIGVSAGACNGGSYVTGQIHRAHYTNCSLVKQFGHEYLGVRTWIKTGNFFNVPLLYDEVPNKLWPFDYHTFCRTEMTFEIVTTNLLTGRAEYFSNHDLQWDDFNSSPELSRMDKVQRKHIMDVFLASSSLPYVSHIVHVDSLPFGEGLGRGAPMLDGGIVDSIPVLRAQQMGYGKNVVILTRNKGYRKKIAHGPVLDVLSDFNRYLLYSRYPNFRRALSHRGEVYNRQLELVEKLEAEGKVLVIRPEEPLVVDRVERDYEKLENLYQEGLEIGRRFCKEVLKVKGC